jgi:hypothetical protein
MENSTFWNITLDIPYRATRRYISDVCPYPNNAVMKERAPKTDFSPTLAEFENKKTV